MDLEQSVEIRDAEVSDAESIAEIYNREILQSHSNYESVPQTVAQRSEWIERLKNQNYPVLVAVHNGIVQGCAALTPFHPVSGYRHTATGSIYLREDARGKGLGKQLIQKLLELAGKRKIHTIIAGVNSENSRSIALMKKMGFQQVGHFKEIGFKNGKWHDDVCLQLILRDSSEIKSNL